MSQELYSLPLEIKSSASARSWIMLALFAVVTIFGAGDLGENYSQTKLLLFAAMIFVDFVAVFFLLLNKIIIMEDRLINKVSLIREDAFYFSDVKGFRYDAGPFFENWPAIVFLKNDGHFSQRIYVGFFRQQDVDLIVASLSEKIERVDAKAS